MAHGAGPRHGGSQPPTGVANVAETYKERFVHGQIETIKKAKEANEGMLRFLSIPEQKDVFLYPENVGIDYINLSGRSVTGGQLQGQVITPRAPVFGYDQASPHPREMTLPWLQQALTERRKSVLDVPSDDPSWKMVTAREDMIGMAPDAAEGVLMHEQVHLDIIDLVGSGHLDKKLYYGLKSKSGLEEALIDYMMVKSGIGLRDSLDEFLEANNTTLEEAEPAFEIWIDILNDARRSEQGSKRNVGPGVGYPGQQYTGRGGHLGLFPTMPGQPSFGPENIQPTLEVKGSREQGVDDFIKSLGGWSDEDIADIFGVPIEYVKERRQTIGASKEAGMTQETVDQPSIADRLKGLLPKGRTESGIVEPPADPGYLLGKQTVGEAMAAQTPEDLQHWDVGAEEGIEGNLVDVGTYNLERTTEAALGDITPWYKNRAMLDPDAATAFNKMKGDYGKDIPIDSAFRSVRHNEVLPGHSGTSNHLKGLALDITDSGAKAWMAKHGSEYGWVLADYKRKDGTQNTTHFNFKGVPEPWT